MAGAAQPLHVPPEIGEWLIAAGAVVIYVNLRLIVQFEIATGYLMNFLADTFLPALADEEKLIA